MKKIKQLFFFSVFTLLSVSIAFGQNEKTILPIDSSTGKITYSEVVTLKDSVSKDELFSRAKICITHLFKNSNSVIQNEDKEAGSIIGKGNFDIHARLFGKDYPGGIVNFTLSIALKDGRFKYIVTSLSHDGAGTNMPSGGDIENGKPKSWTQKQWDTALIETDNKIKNLIASLKLEMNKPTPKSDNW